MSNLEVSINEVVDLKVLIVISPRIEKGFSNLDPTKVSDELNQGEDRDVNHGGVKVVGSILADADSDFFEQVKTVSVPGFQILMTKQVGAEVGVNCQCDDLRIRWKKNISINI